MAEERLAKAKRRLPSIMRQVKKSGAERAVSMGALLLLLSLIVASVYLFLRSKSSLKTAPPRTPSKIEEEFSEPFDVSSWKTYLDEAYGYSVKYPPLLVPREAGGDIYLSFVVFFATKGTKERGFAISVRENKLEEEAGLIKEGIQRDVSGKLKRETKVDKDSYSGIRLDYEPDEASEGEPRTIIILNNGRYSYSISSHPEQIDKIFSTLQFLE